MAHAAAAEPPAQLGFRYGRILVIDHDEGNRGAVRKHLERHGYTVETSADCQHGLELIRTHRFEAVLLDLVMPGSGGLDVLRALRHDTALSDVPVLVMSPPDDMPRIADFIQHGAEDYVTKPVDPVLLQARVSAALDRKRLRDRERLKNAELKELSCALQQSNEDLQRFAYSASHDLQAPVRTITSYIQLLQRRMRHKLTEEELEMFAFAEGAAKRMHLLLRDLLQYSQVSTAELRLEVVDANELLEAVISDLQPLIKEAGATIRREPLPKVVYDAARLRQLFQKLLGNAIKYKRDETPPEVFVSGRAEPRQWRFSVRDNGEGIAPEHTARIFEMFQRLHGEENPGSGIGLALCKRIIERCGGTLWVDSEPGKGSTFSFTIPMPALSFEDGPTAAGDCGSA